MNVMNDSNKDPLLDLEHISKRFGGLQALKDVSLTLYPGEVLALAGDNGAGKSTLIKTISGVHKPDTGTIKYCGKLIHLETPHQARDAGRGARYLAGPRYPYPVPRESAPVFVGRATSICCNLTCNPLESARVDHG